MLHSFGIAAFGWRVAIVADCESTLAVLDRYLFPWLPRSAADPDRADSVFRVLPAENGFGFEVRVGDRAVAHSATLETLVPLLQSLLDEGVVHRFTGLVAVHAGAVAVAGCAILLPGPSHAGKSTLVAELVRRGCVYFSDEYALIDDLGFAHAYPRAMMLRNGQAEARPVLASDWKAADDRGPVPVRLILALEHRPGSDWEIRRVPQSEMLLTLLKNTLTPFPGRGTWCRRCYAPPQAPLASPVLAGRLPAPPSGFSRCWPAARHERLLADSASGATPPGLLRRRT